MKQYQKNPYLRNETLLYEITSNETVSRETISKKKQYVASNYQHQYDDQKKKVFYFTN